MRRILVLAAAAVLFAVSGGDAFADEKTLTCRSGDFERNSCAIDRDAVEVELRRQLSDAACVHERTWGARFGEIWVDDGCAAEFTIYTPDASRIRDGDRVRCESQDFRRKNCSISDRVREVEMVRKISNAPCVYGRSWGFERGRLWVDRGCAGEFEVSVRDSDRGGARRRHDDRRYRQAERIIAERYAIRACRRYGEDHPGKLDANWADANPQESFNASSKGKRHKEWTISGRFKTFKRGREGTARARCVVVDGQVTRFNVN